MLTAMLSNFQQFSATAGIVEMTSSFSLVDGNAAFQVNPGNKDPFIMLSPIILVECPTNFDLRFMLIGCLGLPLF